MSETNLTSIEPTDPPIIRLINQIILDASIAGASDIHFEPSEKSYRIRLRRDGLLAEISPPDLHLANRITARIKIMASLDIAERRLPQDGRFTFRQSSENPIDCRVSTCPTLFGEKIVIRILDIRRITLDLDALGYEYAQKSLLLKALNKPQGMVLVTGPTGSGKTISLYAALQILNTPERNLSTCEDPVEIHLPGINQININPKAGLTFAKTLRAFLRQDPDVMMVGEIRDLETAEIAVQAAQTGHLVLSTLHTNSAIDTLTRLINLGIPAYNVVSSVTLVIAQRLARLLCPLCKVAITLPESDLFGHGFLSADFATLTLFTPKGCNQCEGGYFGRIGIYEILEITPHIRQMIIDGKNTRAIVKQATKDGMQTLQQSGLSKVQQGLISLEEFFRVIPDPI